MVILKRIGLLVLLVAMSAVLNDVSAQTKKKARTSTKKKSATTQQPSGDPFGGANTGSSDPFSSGSKSTSKPSTGGGDPFSSGGGDPFSSKSAGSSKVGNASVGTKRDTGILGGGKIPIEVVSNKGADNPLADSFPVFLRSETVVDDSYTRITERAPLEYEHIREDDAVFRHKIWRIIDAREKMNLPFVYNTKESNGQQLFFAILYHMVNDSSSGVTAFADEDFTIPLSRSEFRSRTSGGVDTNAVYGLDGETIERYEVRVREFPLDSVFSFQLKEEVLFDKESSKLVTRIIGIAPMAPVIVNGKVYPGKHQPLFWLYYPDIRTVLSKAKAYNPKNMANRMTWEDVFESRYFSSYIIKSTLDNPGNQKLDQIYENPLFRLYEGEKIKEKIFDYEQNLWSY